MKNEKWIQNKLAYLDEKDLLRKLTVVNPSKENILVNGEEFINFSSNNYLNLTTHNTVLRESRLALEKFGTGSQASRLVTGTFSIHDEVESILAKFKGCDSTLIFGSGYLANIGIITALAGRDDTIFADRLCHASIMDGIVQSRASLKRFAHNDIDDLEKLLSSHKGIGKKIVITESVFSMDGDIAPLKDLVETSEKYEALIIIDEAHGTGIFGESGSGIVSSLGLTNRVNVVMGTFSKAFGSYGGYAGCSTRMKDYLINFARSFIYTTSLPPAVLGSIKGALSVLKSEKNLGEKLLEKAHFFKRILNESGINTGKSASQIIPAIVGENRKSLEIAQLLLINGIKVNAIRPPTVPEGTARLRFSLTLSHKSEVLKECVQKIVAAFKKTGVL